MQPGRIPMGIKKSSVYGLLLLIVLALAITAAGCTDQGTENVQGDGSATVTAAPTGSGSSIEGNDVFGVDMILMWSDVQSDSPYAYEYLIMPTYYIGKNDQGEYKFAGIIKDYNLDKINYIGVMFSEYDAESEKGYREWLYSGIKFELFSGEDYVNCYNFQFAIPAEEIPEGKKYIKTGTTVYPI